VRRRTEPLTERFELKQLLGSGGMGSVFAAEDRGLGRVVAIKRLREGFEHDPALRRRFVLEAQIGAQLEHPNIVPLYSFERTETGAPAFAMQLVEGVTLTEYMKVAAEASVESRRTGGTYSRKERLGALLGVCDAIHFAHSRGVVHRDLKPDNVMLGRYREVYVMDWGIARLIGEIAELETIPVSRVAPVSKRVLDGARIAATPTLDEGSGQPPGNEPQRPPPVFVAQLAPCASLDLATRPGDVIGTPQYMAPEQAAGRNEDIGPATDQFSLGVILLELATLRRARSSATVEAMLEALTGATGRRDDVDGAPMAPPLLAILGRALQPKPTERYASVEALADDLRSYIRDEPVSAYQEGRARRLVRMAGHRPELSVGAVGAILVLTALIIIVGMFKSASDVARHGRELGRSRQVLVAVEDRARRIDARLVTIGSGVHAIRAATVVSLEHPAISGSIYNSKKDPILAFSDRSRHIGQSFDRPVVSWIGKHGFVNEPASAATLSELDPWLRETLEASLPADKHAASPEVRTASLVHGDAELIRCFVALEDGSFVQLPARTLPDDFDPRQSSWYRRGVREPELHWTRPVADLAGNSLRLQSVAGIRSKGKLLGVTGCDLRVAALASTLDLDLPGFRRAYLVTTDGKIAASKDLEGRVLATEIDTDADLDLPAVDDPKLAIHVAAADTGGFYEAPGDTLIVYARLLTNPWTYVVELDASRYSVGR
jgi:eukaryotic-like serine/threonine-protein kinase